MESNVEFASNAAGLTMTARVLQDIRHFILMFVSNEAFFVVNTLILVKS